ncbi:MAG: helix-turn-helix domain-containing protein [Desulfotomaculales bacterium]
MEINVGQKMKEIRNKLGYTQEGFAHVLECEGRTYKGYERGERKPPFELLLKIAKIGNVDMNYFFSNGDTPWYDRDTPPTDLELEEIIDKMPVRLHGEPLDERTKEDVKIALRIIYEQRKREREEKATKKYLKIKKK